MASQFYNAGKKNIIDGSVNLLTDTIKVALTTASYTPNIDSDDFFNDVTNEVSGTGYTAGGATLASKSITQDNANDRAAFDAADVSWSNSTITNARWAVVYKSTGTAATSPLIAYIDLLANRSSSADTFKIEWAPAGVFYLT
jgi:hypothetical protein